MLLTACSHLHWGFQHHRLADPEGTTVGKTKKWFAIGGTSSKGKRKGVEEDKKFSEAH